MFTLNDNAQEAVDSDLGSRTRHCLQMGNTKMCINGTPDHTLTS